jgi:chaperonin cofactor prefoldin
MTPSKKVTSKVSKTVAAPVKAPAKPAGPKPLMIPVSVGDALDRISILKVKVDKLPEARAKIAQQELDAIEKALKDYGIKDWEANDTFHSLCHVNCELWDTEDKIRTCHKAPGRFHDLNVETLSKQISDKNERRASLKTTLDKAFDSVIRDQKEYFGYSNDTE